MLSQPYPLPFPSNAWHAGYEWAGQINLRQNAQGNTYLQKLIPVPCNRRCKQHLHIVVSNAVKQHFLDIPIGLDKNSGDSINHTVYTV